MATRPRVVGGTVTITVNVRSSLIEVLSSAGWNSNYMIVYAS